jgi:hypothetical protein
MRFDDHLKKIKALEKTIAELRERRLQKSEIVDYLMSAGEGLITAAKILMEADTSKRPVIQPQKQPEAGGESEKKDE